MKAILKITKQGWTGWSKEQPKPEEETIEAESGNPLETFGGEETPLAMVKDVNESSITLVTSKLAPRKGTSGINLREDYSNLETVVKKGESVEFTTQTMDAGTKYTLMVVDIKL